MLNELLIYAFTDRPYRKSQHVDTKLFLSLWEKKMKDSFSLDNPNAALAGVDYIEKDTRGKSTQELSQMVILKDVTVVHPHDLRFNVENLDASVPLKPSKFHHAVLFVDDQGLLGM